MKILIVPNEVTGNQTELSLINYLKEQGDSVFVFDLEQNNESLMKDLDLIYILSPSKVAQRVIKDALKNNIPLVMEYVKQVSKEQTKKLYRSFYRFANAIHYQNKSDQDNLEYLVVRRTNGHVFRNGDFEKLRNMLLQYADEINHSDKQKLYYSNELNDDFAFQKIKVQKETKPFKYIHKNPLWRTCAFISYHLLAKPVAFFLNKLTFHQKIYNKDILKKHLNRGYFIYANHTQGMADAFTPNLLTFKKNYIVVGREAVSIKGLKTIVTMVGGIPVFKSIEEVKPFNE